MNHSIFITKHTSNIKITKKYEGVAFIKTN